MRDLALHSTVRRVVLMWCSQVAKSEICNNLIGYVADWVPCPIMMLRPTIDDCEGYSKQRLRHLFASPTLSGKVQAPRSRDSGNTLMLKEFPGGMLILAGANAPARLASWPVRVLVADEIDRYPPSAGTEGDPLALARARLTAFGDRAKVLLTSTPTLKDSSRIETEYNASSRGHYHVACPECGHRQALKWPNLHWSGEPGRASFAVWYECEDCHGSIDEHHKGAMLAGGVWVHDDPDNPTRGYHLNALCAPVGSITWGDLVREWLAANVRAKIGDTSLLQVFVNTRLAETWEDRGQVVDSTSIANRGEEWADVPAGVKCITIGADVQDDRVECEVVGWGAGMESWSLGYHVIPTDPLDAGTWQALDTIVLREWRTVDGRRLKAAATCVDSGYRTQAVYDYARARSRWRVFATKGVSGQGKAIWDRKARKGGKNKTGGTFRLVGVDAAKDAVAAYLRILAPGPGYCHFPQDRATKQPDYFTQLTSEKRVPVTDRNGRRRWEWRLPVDGRRNEALDCRVYALAALHSLLAAGARLESPEPILTPDPAPPAPAQLMTGKPAPEHGPRVPSRPAPRHGWGKPGPKRGW